MHWYDAFARGTYKDITYEGRNIHARGAGCAPDHYSLTWWHDAIGDCWMDGMCIGRHQAVETQAYKEEVAGRREKTYEMDRGTLH